MTAHRGTKGLVWVAVVVALAVLAAGCAQSAPPAPQPTATPTEAPTLSPDEAAAAAVLASFGALTERDDLSYHVSQTTTMRLNGERFGRAVDDLDVNGPDFAGTMSAAGKTMRVVHVDGVTWAKLGKRAWKKGAPSSAEAAAEVVDTWRNLGPLDGLVYAGRDQSDPARLEFTNSRPVTYQTVAMKELGMQGVIDKLTLTLAPDGTPLGLQFHATGSFISGAMADRKVSIDSVIGISRFGEAITVNPPK